MRRVGVLVVLAVALAVLAGFAAYTYLSGAEDRALARYEMVSVLFSQDTIPEGTSLADAVAEGLAAPSEFPADFVPSNAISSITPDIADLVTPVELAEGQILLVGDFTSATPEPDLLAVPDGKVAVSIALTEAARLAPFLEPGDQVVLFTTYDAGANGQSEPTTRVLLPQVEVLAVGASTASGVPLADPADAPADGLVTLSLAPADAARVVQAIADSQIYLGRLGGGTLVPVGAPVQTARG